MTRASRRRKRGRSNVATSDIEVISISSDDSDSNVPEVVPNPDSEVPVKPEKAEARANGNGQPSSKKKKESKKKGGVKYYVESKHDDSLNDGDLEDPLQGFYPVEWYKKIEVEKTKKKVNLKLNAAIVESGNRVMRLVLLQASNKKRVTTKDLKQFAELPASGRDVFSKTIRHAQEGLEDLLGIQLIPHTAVKHMELDPASGQEITQAKKQNVIKEHAYARADTVWYLRSKKATLSERGKGKRELAERGVLMVVLGLIIVERGKTSEKIIIDGLQDLKLDMLKAREYLSKLWSEGWLKRMKNADSTAQKIFWDYTIGNRSYVEIGIPNIIYFVEQTSEMKLTKTERSMFYKL